MVIYKVFILSPFMNLLDLIIYLLHKIIGYFGPIDSLKNCVIGITLCTVFIINIYQYIVSKNGYYTFYNNSIDKASVSGHECLLLHSQYQQQPLLYSDIYCVPN